MTSDKSRKKKHNKSSNLPRYVYALVDPRNNQVRYVGCSLNPEKRLGMHVRAANWCSRSWSNKGNYHGLQPRFRWLSSLSDLGLKPRLIILEECSADCWRNREDAWIQHYLEAGVPLTNVKVPAGEDHYTHECFIPGKERYLLSEDSRERIERHIRELERELSKETRVFKRKYIELWIDDLSNKLKLGAA